MYLTAKFDRPTFSRSAVVVRKKHTDKQTDSAENTYLASLHYADGYAEAVIFTTASVND